MDPSRRAEWPSLSRAMSELMAASARQPLTVARIELALIARLALIGVEARVESVTINDNQSWYRVRVGPIAEAPRVHSVMMRLSEHGMDDAMLVRVKK